MNSPEGSAKQLERAPLPHIPDVMVIGITQSPDSKPCVGMTHENRDWILLTSKRAPMVAALRGQLRDMLGVDSIEGAPFDWRESLTQNKLILTQNKGVQGIFVPAEHFDRLVEDMVGL